MPPFRGSPDAADRNRAARGKRKRKPKKRHVISPPPRPAPDVQDRRPAPRPAPRPSPDTQERREQSRANRAVGQRAKAQAKVYATPRGKGIERQRKQAEKEQGHRKALSARGARLNRLLQTREGRKNLIGAETARLGAQRGIPALLPSGILNPAYGSLDLESRRRLARAGFLPDPTLAERFASQLVTSAVSIPFGLYEVGKAGALDVRDLATKRDFTPKRTAGIARAIGEGIAEDIRHPLRNPGYLAADILGAVGGGVGLAAKVGPVGRALGKGKRRTFKVGELEVEGSYSRSPLAAAGQRLGDVLREAGIGPGLRRTREKKAGFELKENLRTEQALENAPALALKRLGRRLDSAEQTALRVVAEGVPIAERIAFHERRKAEAKSALARRRHEKKAALVRAAARYVDDADGVPQLSANASDRLRRAYELAREIAGRREGTLTGLGRLSDEAAEGRISGPGRVLTTGEALGAPGAGRQLSLLEQPAFMGGEFRVPYEAGRLQGAGGGVFGRFGGGRGKAIGYPKELTTTTNAFRGRLLLEGRFKDKVTDLVADDYLRAQRFGAVLRAREQLLKAANDLPQSLDDVPIRTESLKGKPLPPALREAFEEVEEAKLTKKSLRGLSEDDISILRTAVFPDDVHPSDVLAEGKPIPGIKWVNADLLYESGLGAPRQALARVAESRGGRKALGIFDAINDAQRIGVIFLRPAYVPVNLLSNLGLALVHQGAFAPKHLARSARKNAGLEIEEAAKLDSVMQEGAALALRGEFPISRQVANAFAHVYSRAVDVPFRRASFFHEARRAGYKSKADVKRLLNDEDLRGELIQIARRANREIIDYSRLGPLERSVIRRILFVYPWMKGATLYTARFPAEHPVQTAIGVQVGRYGEEQREKQLGRTPEWMRGMVKIGEDEDGNPILINPITLTPFESAIQLGEAAAGTLGVLAGRDFNRFSDDDVLAVANPFLESYFGARAGDKPFPEQVAESVALYRLIEGLRHPGERSNTFPTSREEAVGTFLAGSLYPRVADREAVERQGWREHLEGLEPPERLREKQRKEVKDLERLALKAGVRVPPWARKLMRLQHAIDAGRLRAQEANPEVWEIEEATLDERTPEQKLAIARARAHVDISAVERYVRSDLSHLRHWVNRASNPDAIERLRRGLREETGLSELARFKDILEDRLAAKKGIP